MNRFENPEQQYEVLRFHVQLVQVLTNILIKEYQKGEKYNDYQKNNIIKFIKHTVSLTEFKTTASKEQDLIRSFKKWCFKNPKKN